jgi:GntR family transcriptional regulator
MPARQTYRARVYEDITSKIEKRLPGFLPGDELPPDHELKAWYGCSLQPVLRAMEDLDRDGWVERRQGKRTVVAQNPPTGGSGTE